MKANTAKVEKAKAEKIEVPVLKTGEVFVVVRGKEVLKVRKYHSDARQWQKKLPGSTIEVRKEGDVKKPARKPAAKPKAAAKAKAEKNHSAGQKE